ncbi:DUF3459 domain-containing protein [Sphingomonas sp. DT-51]|uniref:DUF3459 domain-containing protein n=1 Tax=Sphingomonas sp. DT-51 TaxID=3396165 RepID=UPI003F1D5A4D
MPRTYEQLLGLGRETHMPRLEAKLSKGAEPIGGVAVVARWSAGDGARLTIPINLRSDALALRRFCRFRSAEGDAAASVSAAVWADL